MSSLPTDPFTLDPSRFLGGDSDSLSESDYLSTARTSAFPSAMASGAMTPYEQDGLYEGIAPENLHAALLQVQGSGSALNASNEYYGLGASSASTPRKQRGRGRMSEEQVQERNRRRLEHNRISAKQSRERKKVFIAALESHVEHLEQLRESLQATVTKLVEENQRLRIVAGLEPSTMASVQLPPPVARPSLDDQSEQMNA
jgi:hypothetical protein